MLHFFRGFESVTFGNFSVPIVQNESYFSTEWDKWGTLTDIQINVTFQF